MKLFHKNKKTLDELKRAHFIIALLSFSFAFLLVTASLQPFTFDVTLSLIASLLLVIMAAISTVVALALSKKS